MPTLRGQLSSRLLPALLIGFSVVSSTAPQAVAAEADAKSQVDFGRDVRPILAKACYHCHGPDKAEGGLNFTDAKSPFGELDSGERGIIPGDLEHSEILNRIATTDDSMRMPPEGKPLSQDQINTLKAWIEQGAPWESHWAFKPVQRPAVPDVTNKGWVKSPIDAFILKKLEEKGLQPSEPASKAALIRRAYYDLVGLPPTLQEVNEFANSTDPMAYEKLVDKLLAHPGYGEKWGRHWLDLVRYAETNSFERDAPKPNAWRYRDYVIKSLNDDKPYDQFVREQIAGDELKNATDETKIATGYYRLGIWDDEPADRKQAYYDEMDDTVATTTHAFLGLTVACARCHDHKIDPIPQSDYYQMVAFFRDVRSYGARGDKGEANQIDISGSDLSRKHMERDRKIRQLSKRIKEIEQAAILKMPGEIQRKTEGDERDEALREHLRNHLNDEQWQKYEDLKSQRDRVKEQELPPRVSALGVANCDANPPETHILGRGNPHVEKEVVKPGYPDIYNMKDPEIPAPGKDAETAGRRVVLADWIASPDNMLTTRVIANRVWQFHFGRGIVRSSNNFGLLGDAPTHPELLDWLASEVVAKDWKLKALHREIMLSNAYQMSSATNAKADGMDPQNNLFWKFDMRRLTAEEIRDSMLVVAGVFNPKMYGPSIYPKISDEVMAGQSMPGAGWGESSEEDRNRRSIYIHVKRSLLSPLLAAFDYPEPDSSCEARFSTTQPTQALGMLNSDDLQDLSAKLAARLQRERPDDLQAQVRLAYELITSRRPNVEEIEMGLTLIEKLKSEGANDDQARQLFCLAAYNLNEFIFLE